MDAAVSLHHGRALPAASSLPPPPLPLPLPLPLPQPLHLLSHPPPSSSSSVSARLGLAVTAAPRSRAAPARSSSSSPAPVPAVVPAHSSSSSRAATGYAAALADASLKAGTLRRASRHACAVLRGRQHVELDAQVGALVRMLVGKGKARMVAEVMAEFAAICDRLLPCPPQRLVLLVPSMLSSPCPWVWFEHHCNFFRILVGVSCGTLVFAVTTAD